MQVCTGGASTGAALLQTLLVSLDHFLDHLAADGAGLTGGQVTVVAGILNCSIACFAWGTLI